MKEFNNRCFGFSAHDDNMVVDKTFFYEIRGTRPHENDTGILAVTLKHLNGFEIAFYRQVHRPDTINVAIVGSEKVAVVLFVFFIKYKVLVINLTQVLILDHSNNGQFIYVWCKIHHPCAAGRAFSGAVTVKDRRHQKCYFHIIVTKSVGFITQSIAIAIAL